MSDHQDNPGLVPGHIYWSTKEFITALESEIAATERGETEDLGSFAKYADDEGAQGGPDRTS